jgi:hypothetical protein
MLQERADVFADVLTYNLAIDACKEQALLRHDERACSRAHDLFGEMEVPSLMQHTPWFMHHAACSWLSCIQASCIAHHAPYIMPPHHASRIAHASGRMMQRRGLAPNSYTCVALVAACRCRPAAHWRKAKAAMAASAALGMRPESDAVMRHEFRRVCLSAMNQCGLDESVEVFVALRVYQVHPPPPHCIILPAVVHHVSYTLTQCCIVLHAAARDAGGVHGAAQGVRAPRLHAARRGGGAARCAALRRVGAMLAVPRPGPAVIWDASSSHTHTHTISTPPPQCNERRASGARQ